MRKQGEKQPSEARSYDGETEVLPLAETNTFNGATLNPDNITTLDLYRDAPVIEFIPTLGRELRWDIPMHAPSAKHSYTIYLAGYMPI
ncbi:MAG: hypothetical protein DHS20C10_04690 [marine bacterium B5-7]|nr:MAG: hypothetical protein DHS20C10_04690 [marine bacterium B5-7]